MQSPKWRRYRQACHQTLGTLTDEARLVPLDREELRELVTLWPMSTATEIAYRLHRPRAVPTPGT